MSSAPEKIVVCPQCGSEDWTMSSETFEQEIPLYGLLSVPIANYLCNHCGMKGDFSNQNDHKVEEQKKQAITASINSILENLGGLGFNNVAIERSLSLPPRTLNRWKTGGHSEAAVALMRIVATFPWILDVAKQKFHRVVADKYLVTHAAQTFYDFVAASGMALPGFRSSSPKLLSINFFITTNNEDDILLKNSVANGSQVLSVSTSERNGIEGKVNYAGRGLYSV